MIRRWGLATQAGFTLLELLVVLVVLGLLMVGLSQGVRAGLALWEAQAHRLGETAELDAASRVLRQLLSGMSPPVSGGPLTGAAGEPTFKGAADSLTFIGDLPTGLGTTQRAEIVLELRERRLVLRWKPHHHETMIGAAPAPVETELVRRVERLDLAYWGSPSPDQAAGWQSQWVGPALPELIRLRLGLPNGDRRRFPGLIVAPRL